MKCKILLALLLILFCGDNHIIQRAAEDYFPLDTEYWWLYGSGNDTIFVEVEPADTLLGIEYFPVSYNGVVRNLAESDNGIAQYVKIVYDYAGNDHTIIEDFLMRIELPLIKDNSYQYFLSDSIDVAGQLIKASYEINGTIVDYTSDDDYGDVYELSLRTIESLITPDTSIIDTTDVTEFYAPGIGMIRFSDGTSEYRLIEYSIP